MCCTVEAVYNDSSPIMMLFSRSQENSYISRAFEFSYNNFSYMITSPKATHFFSYTEYFVYNYSCKFS